MSAAAPAAAVTADARCARVYQHTPPSTVGPTSLEPRPRHCQVQPQFSATPGPTWVDILTQPTYCASPTSCPSRERSTARKVPGPRASHFQLPGTDPSWHEAIEGYALNLRAGGSPAGTLRLRRHYLHDLAIHVAPAGPWAVTPAQLVTWPTSSAQP